MDEKGRQAKMDDEKAFYSEKHMDLWNHYWMEEHPSVRARCEVEDKPAEPQPEDKPAQP